MSFPKVNFNTKEEFSDSTVLIKQLESECRMTDDFSIDITRSILHIVITKLFRIKSKAGSNVKGSKYMSQFLKFQNLVERDCFKSKKVNYYSELRRISTRTLTNNTNSKIHI